MRDDAPAVSGLHALARLPFFVQIVRLNIAAAVLVVAIMPLFLHGSRGLWWCGVIGIVASFLLVAVGLVSMFVRRLHDPGPVRLSCHLGVRRSDRADDTIVQAAQCCPLGPYSLGDMLLAYVLAGQPRRQSIRRSGGMRQGHFTASNSTSKMSVALGGMTPPAPFSP